MDRVLIKLYVPMLEEVFDMWIPVNKRIGNVIKLLMRAINEINENVYLPKQMPMLYDKITGEMYDANLTIKESTIRSGAEIVLI